jgi:alpha-tubulin suppressor-like RCC1 family protein
MIYTIDRFVPSENDEHEPYPLLTKPVLDLLYATDERITQVACGSDYYLSLTSSGFVYSWGLGNKYSQLGRKILSENKKTEMKRLHRLDLESIIQISGILRLITNI